MFRANDDAAAVEMFPGVVRRTLNSGDRTTLIEVTLAEGAVVPSHTHPHEQVGYVASGRVRFEIDGEERELRAGDSYLVPGGASHEVTALEPSVCIDVFSPVREEYL
ncbi:MAG: cupin domain-containing protein [Chloroflexi bacterium]|nr:cupin domain-containing protein [Chloroflexota bacterium]